MATLTGRVLSCGSILAAVLAGACGAANEAPQSEELTQTASALTAQQRLAACTQDQRVVAGLVSKEICAGADIFFRETFNGNGRTCGSCHPANNNFTIDRNFISQLHQTKPNDPLFVFETNPNLSQLETGQLFNGGILENVDGFQDPTHRFVHRSVPHVLSMKTSLDPDPTDGVPNPPQQRTGWGGDGAPGNGTLREFLNGAIKQHYPKTLARVEGPDFRLATAQELDLTAAFQLALGRQNEIDLQQVRLTDADAELGRQAYLDPQQGRCNFCHFNGGANSQLTAKNANFDTGTRFRPSFGAEGSTPDGRPIFDGGFGGQNFTSPNIVTFPLSPDDTTPNGFGDNTFNTPPVIEASDTLPGFHNDNSTTPEAITFFYISPDFQRSKASADLIQRFGTPINFDQDTGNRISRFIRILNAALNLDMAKQRLNAAQTLANRFHNTNPSLQITLMQLAKRDVTDALMDLNDGLNPIQPCYPVAQDRLGLASSEIDAGIAAPDWSSRQSHISTAISRVQNARDQFGSNMNFQLGAGNLMF